jgi:two-component system, cell cycle sensor histidine kinase and response regulator CckA
MLPLTRVAAEVAFVDPSGDVISANAEWLAAGRAAIGERVDVELLASAHGARLEALPLTDGGMMLRIDAGSQHVDVLETQLEQAQLLAGLGTFDWSLDGDALHWSEHACRIWGYEPDEVEPTLALLASHLERESLVRVRRVLERIARGQRRVELTFRMRRRDGEPRTLHAAAEVVADAAGRPSRVFGILTDTTLQERVNARLRAHAQREAAVADIGWEALRHREIQPLLETTVDLARGGAGADACAVLQRDDDGVLVVRAASGLPEWLGRGVRDDLSDLGMRCAAKAVIGEERAPFGVIALLWREPHRFDADEVTFLQSVANVVAEAVQRRRVESALAASELALREFFQRSPAAMFRARADGTLLAANDAFARLLGFASAAEVMRINLKGVYERPAERLAIIRELEQHEQVARELEWRRRDGSTIFVALVWTGIRDAAGKLVAWEGFAQDVTERRTAVELLTASERRHRQLFENTFEAVLQGDPSGNIYEFNDEFSRLFGWTRAALGRLRRTHIFEESHAAVVAMLETLSQSGCFRGEMQLMRADGTRFPAEVSIRRYEESKGVPRTSVVIRDVSERHAAEQQIRIQAAMLDSVQHAIVAADSQMNVIYWNRAAEELFGYSARETIGRNLRKEPLALAEPNARLGEAMRSVLRNRAWTGELTMHARDGRRFPGLLALAPIVGADGNIAGTVGVTADLTQIRQLEAQLEQARRVASLGNLAATVAHEFNNVLMGVQPFGEIVRLRAAGDPRLLDAARHIERAVRRGKHVAQDILRYTQHNEPNIVPVRLRDLLDDAAAAAREEGLEVAVDCAPELAVHVDAMQVQQVLINLLANARDAMRGGGTVRIAAVPASGSGQYPFGIVPHPERFARIEVRDSGSGIEADVVKHIFEPLFTTKRTGGTGLGLAIVHRIVARHEGHIFVETEVGRGTAFHLFFPLAGEAPEVEPIVRRDGERPRGRLLLVEDDALIATGMAALLQDEGIPADIVALGGDAVAKIEETNPDAVVLDLNLPDISGEQVYRDIAARWPRLPVIFSTGHGDEDGLAEHLEHQNVTYLLKPYDLDTLLGAVRRVTAR